ncbi:MAG: site-specific integrase [Bacteroides eggerthii]|nr:site-specific integrase [Bacteroides eggerthii]
MARKRKLLIMPQLKDCGGDLNKKWYVEYSLRNPQTGEMKRFRHYDGFSELKSITERRLHAEKIIAEIKLKLEKGNDPFSDKTITYQDELIYQTTASRWGKEREAVICARTYLSEFLVMKETELAHSSYQTYKSKLRIFCEWLENNRLGEKNVRCITEEHIHMFFYYIADNTHISRRTVMKYKQLLHTFFDYLLKNKKVIPFNPVINIPNLGEKRDEAARPIPDTIRKKLTDYMREYDPQLLLMCELEYYCAIRPKEGIHLLVGDINLENATITVRQDISKNGLTETVNIPRQLYDDLADLLQVGRYPDTYYLFSNDGMPGKNRLGKNTLRYRFDRIRDKLGFSKKYKLYSFKHTGAAKLVNAGINTWELQKHFRHKSVTTTERYLAKRFGVNSHIIKVDFPDM